MCASAPGSEFSRTPTDFKVLMPILLVTPLQLLAYHIAVLRGCAVDQRHNLAKSVKMD